MAGDLVQLDEITVTVRDKTLAIQGMIRPEDLDLEASIEHNNVGSWQLKLAAEHPLAPILRTPGSGIVVQGPADVLFSGPTTTPETAITVDDPGGTVTITGVTDTVILADALAYADPTLDISVEGQTKANDWRTGKSETLMHQYVNANIGPAAIASRRKTSLIMGTDLQRGTTVTKGPRFQPLGELLAELTIQPALQLGFRVVQRGTNLVFETYQITDKRGLIRLDARNRTLAGQRVALSPPGLTTAIVAGQGVGSQRQLFEITTAASTAARAEWGRRIERFIDRRDTNDPAALQAAGIEVLNAEGFTALAVQAIPAEDSFMTFGTDWSLGDKITVVVENQELSADVTGFVLRANSDGFKVGVVIGDPQGFSTTAALNQRVTNTEQRISAIERQVEIAAPEPWTKRATIWQTTSNTATIPHNVWTKIRFVADRGQSRYLDPAFPDIGHEWETTGGNGWFYLPTPGRYQINLNVTFAPSTAGVRYARAVSMLRGNITHTGIPATNGWGGVYLSVLHVVSAADAEAGEAIRFELVQTSGAALGFPDASDQYQNMSIQYLGRGLDT
ncbi:siphovirus ReqiPepy6 Gp37-like family protein [Kribbella sp. NBC_01505]|uniref:siphovirus ReqiPepy6 Gp37-like family protein n=1 Tax=Kribbella sp. NBC_01505 TaxID=2903580 RepID=UPI0038630359